MKDLIKLGIFLTFSFYFIIGCSIECSVNQVQVINDLKNYQSIIGYVRDCGATSAYTINVSFIRPGMNIKSERGEVFRATHTSDLQIEKVSKDKVKIVFSASKDDIVTKVDSMYGIKFIYYNNWDN